MRRDLVFEKLVERFCLDECDEKESEKKRKKAREEDEKLLKKIEKKLVKHKKWLNNEKGGEKADFSHYNFLADSSGWHCTNEYEKNIESLFQKHKNFLKEIDFSYSELPNALKGANLEGANLTNVNLEYFNLRDTNFKKAILKDVRLSGAHLEGAKFDKKEQIRQGILLKKPLIGFKKCKYGVIVKLLIPEGATVFSINNGKCRTNKATVVKIYNSSDGKAVSMYDGKFIYEVGKKFEFSKKKFNFNYNQECASGIHFFKTKKEAKNYEL